MSSQETPFKILSSNWKHEKKIMGTSLQPERCSAQKPAEEICLDHGVEKKKLSGSWDAWYSFLSVQNKLLTLMTVLSEMVYFKTVKLHQKEWSLEWQHAVKQGKLGWGLTHLQKGFLSCSCFRTGLHIKSCKTWGLGRKNWQPEAQQFHLWCWDKDALWRDLEQIWPSYRAMCAWFFCLLLSIYLSTLLNWILKCKAIFCLQGAPGEMLGVSVAGNCTLFCLLLINEQPLTLCKTLPITVCLSLSPKCPCGSSGTWRSLEIPSFSAFLVVVGFPTPSQRICETVSKRLPVLPGFPQSFFIAWAMSHSAVELLSAIIMFIRIYFCSWVHCHSYSWNRVSNV